MLSDRARRRSASTVGFPSNELPRVVQFTETGSGVLELGWEEGWGEGWLSGNRVSVGKVRSPGER